MDQARRPARGIDHVGITVPDLEAAAAFLENAFGAQVLYDSHTRDQPPQAGAKTEAKLGIEAGAQIVAIRMLRLGNGANVELFAMKAADQHPAARPSDYGLQHLAFYCDHLEAAAARFAAAGGRLYAGPLPLPPKESGLGNQFWYGQTPWGTVVELVTMPSPAPYEDDTALRRWKPPV